MEGEKKVLVGGRVGRVAREGGGCTNGGDRTLVSRGLASRAVRGIRLLPRLLLERTRTRRLS